MSDRFPNEGAIKQRAQELYERSNGAKYFPWASTDRETQYLWLERAHEDLKARRRSEP